MVLLIAGPPVEVGVTMYVLSISSVSEVLMVQFAFSNSYRTHNELSRPFHFFLLLLIHLFPCPLSPLSLFFVRVPSRVYLPTPPSQLPPFFRPPRVQFEDRSRRVRSIDRSCRDRARRSSHYAACFRLFVSRLSNPRACNERSIPGFDKYRGSVKFERGVVRRDKYSCEYSFVQRFALCVQKKKRKMA